MEETKNEVVEMEELEEESTDLVYDEPEDEEDNSTNFRGLALLVGGAGLAIYGGIKLGQKIYGEAKCAVIRRINRKTVIEEVENEKESATEDSEKSEEKK